MLNTSLCNYSVAYIPVKGTISFTNMAASGAAENNNNEEVIFKNCTWFTDCISEINNTQIDSAKDIDVVMSMYDLIKYSDNYSKKSGSLWQYYRDESPNFPCNSTSFKFKQKLTGKKK